MVKQTHTGKKNTGVHVEQMLCVIIILPTKYALITLSPI